MNYIDTRTKEYPLTEADIKARNPNVSYPVPFDAAPDYQQVISADIPTFDSLTHKIEPTTPVLTDGIWKTGYKIIKLTNAEKQIRFDQVVESLSVLLSSHLDSVAQQRKYDNRITCALRAGYPGPFQAEGQAFAIWMDTCNATAYQALEEIKAGTRQFPATAEEFISLLPQITWPSK